MTEIDLIKKKVFRKLGLRVNFFKLPFIHSFHECVEQESITMLIDIEEHVFNPVNFLGGFVFKFFGLAVDLSFFCCEFVAFELSN